MIYDERPLEELVERSVRRPNLTEVIMEKLESARPPAEKKMMPPISARGPPEGLVPVTLAAAAVRGRKNRCGIED